MPSRRAFVFVVATLLGVVAATASYEYLTSAQTRAYANARMVGAFVVTQPIPRGATGDQAIAAGFLKPEQVPAQFRPAGAVTDLAVIKGKVAVANLPSGQILVNGLFASAQSAELTFSQRIPAGDVAVTVSVDQVHGVANLPVPGDLVDVLVDVSGTEHYVLQNVPILAIGSATAPQPGAAQPTTPITTPGPGNGASSGLITFSVPPLAAERIVLAAQAPGGIWLSLVPPDNKAGAVPPVNQAEVFNGSVTPS